MIRRITSLALVLMTAALGSTAVANPLTDNASFVRHRVAPPAPPSSSYEIVVDKFGNAVRGSDETSSFQGGRGTYIATFPVDMTNCVYVGSLGRALKFGGAAEPGGYITVVRSSGFPNGVFVQTFGPRGEARNRAFHLIVAC